MRGRGGTGGTAPAGRAWGRNQARAAGFRVGACSACRVGRATRPVFGARCSVFGQKRGTRFGVAHGAVRTVLVRGGAIVWSTEVLRADGSAGALAVALASVPRRAPRLSRRVTAAVGPSASQLRCLSELPPLTGPRAVAQVVREGAGRFFLGNGVCPALRPGWVDGPRRSRERSQQVRRSPAPHPLHAAVRPDAGDDRTPARTPESPSASSRSP